jgi:hypothetical protein
MSTTHTRFEQARIGQLLSTYGPSEPPRLQLDFGDYLSLLWRIDHHAAQPGRSRYYRACANALARGLRIHDSTVHRLAEQSQAGEIYRALPNVPYRGRQRLVDAQDRKAAITQLIALRGDIFRMGTYDESWGRGYPGSGIVDPALRERVFAVMLTALQGQFANFARLLLVVDIVLGDLLLESNPGSEIGLADLIALHQYPDPIEARTAREFALDAAE